MDSLKRMLGFSTSVEHKNKVEDEPMDREDDGNVDNVRQQLASIANANTSREELLAKLQEMQNALATGGSSDSPSSNNSLTNHGSVPPPNKPNPKPSQPSPPNQRQPLNDRMVVNNAGGYSFAVCDMMRLKRFLVIGSEKGSFYVTAAEDIKQNIECLARLVHDGHGLAVLDVLEDFSVKGRVAKETPILLALSICATFPGKVDVQQAAYKKVATICNIPTKLFQFVELCQKSINAKRVCNPPRAQPSKKRPRVEESIASLKIDKTPTENEEEDQPIPKKKRLIEKKRTPSFKKVNTKPKRSSGWGRMRRKGIGSFYKSHEPDRLLYLLTKYKQRNNWSHKQVLGYAHPKMEEEENSVKKAKDFVLTYSTRGYETFVQRSSAYRNEDENRSIKIGTPQNIANILTYIDVLHAISRLNSNDERDEETLLDHMKKFGVRHEREDFSNIRPGFDQPMENHGGLRSAFQIVREHIPTGFLKSKKVWEALLKDMPMTALIRNLGKMSSMDLFLEDNPETNANVKIVCEALGNVKRLQKARVHPIKILIALKMYEQGKGEKGDLHWQKNQYIVDALDKAFYLSFKQPDIGKEFKTGKSYMLCLDVSGSMTWQGCYGCESITPAMASAAMALVTWNIEETVDIMAFGGHFESLDGRLRKDMSINEALSATRSMNFGATDCSLPMQYSMEHQKDVDVFIVYTDSDTWSGKSHPPTALKQYNRVMNKNAKLIVCAMQSNGFTIADPEDPNMLDICGFDTSVPDIISTFSQGSITDKCDVCKDCKIMKANMEDQMMPVN